MAKQRGFWNDRNEMKFNKLVENLKDRNYEFQIQVSGSTKYVKIEDVVHDFKFHYEMQGIHLVKELKKHLDKKFKVKNPDYNFDIKPNYKTKDFNIDNIRKNVGKMCMSIDFEDCYWDTMHNLGYIDFLFWISGLEKDEWKSGRNAAIGALRKKKYTNYYKGRNFIKQTVDEEESYIGGIGITNHVYNHVWAITEEIKAKYPENYLMFYTDCIWLVDLPTYYIDLFLRTKKYFSNPDLFEITSLDERKREVVLTNIADEHHYKMYQKFGTLNSKGKVPRLPQRTYQYSSDYVKIDNNIDTSNYEFSEVKI
jgi:hypothetical protein